ncbi:MAG: nickel-responsive transcriptional regulator NikR [Phycisphaerales bacterium]|nr:MAG: nickel-responsive transcriptional regulator NikR [Phycisphaerales bacterium]UCF16268.1 MAG: nickel-responsive transcriptional regulator NikR [Phycisphaerales bacterium]
MSQTERVGVSLDKKLLSMFDEMIARQGYANRSEAIRDLIRNRLCEQRLAKPSTQAVAGVFLVYDHHSTQLSGTLLDLQHSHLLQVIAATHVHLDHHNCLEVIILRGKVGEVEKVANSMACLKGVKLSKVNVMTTGKDLT